MTSQPPSSQPPSHPAAEPAAQPAQPSSLSLQRPDHLATPSTPGSVAGAWILAHAAGLLALLVGGVGFIVVLVKQVELLDQPNWRLTIPLFVATLIPTAVAFARKEKSYALPLLGLGLSAVAMVLGWFFMIIGVALAAAVLIAIASALS